jgi:hypothetical protein
MKKQLINDVFASVTISALLLVAIFPAIEVGQVFAQAATTTGATTTGIQITVKQQVTAEISLTVASTAITMLPAIPGMTGGTGNGSTTVKIITNNNTGYTVTIVASGTTYAMKGDSQGGEFKDYPTATPQTWADSSTGGSSRFGFGITNTSVTGGNTASGYTTCATTEACFSSMPTTTARNIVTNASETTYVGDTIDLKFRAQIPANPIPLMPEDWYTATATITALTN